MDESALRTRRRRREVQVYTHEDAAGADDSNDETDYDLPDVSTAWLLLSHSGWIVTGITSISVGIFLLFNTTIARQRVRALAIGWLITGLHFMVWTFYAVIRTCIANNKIPRPVFNNFAFGWVLLIIINVIVFNIWTIVDAFLF